MVERSMFGADIVQYDGEGGRVPPHPPVKHQCHVMRTSRSDMGTELEKRSVLLYVQSAKTVIY